MSRIEIKPTNNPAIVKFETEDFIVKGKSYEFKNIDDTKNSPLAMQLFYLPFVKTVFISGNFIAIEKFSIVEWEDVQEEVANQIADFIEKGGIIIKEEETKKVPITIYGETTPNPAVMKFVSNKLLTKTMVECKNIEETKASPLAKELYNFPFVKEIFIDENYISITKYDIVEWEDVTFEIRNFIKEYLELGNVAVDETKIVETVNHQKQQDVYFDKLDTTSQQIVNILEEYVKPAVQSDGGNIMFDSYNEEDKTVKVILQGACSGCPSSTFTLKNGIENMLKQMLHDNEIKVEALNA
ncbi:NifU family protein [Flavobacterium haoranii]|uniref:Fe-S cluster biogenesis protein NfuA, 4Fe-4S-binding domain n=1 Tax=Flavobacterium haoranii TaxID=683124 RepID=A0A1M6FVI1_9FLAO|nr:NifU family protein [Flavobacterium haoranii]SHJ01707.1 Fe-S cluster biogenesis protein NfuA, 4Fe-4S-binding domain [Flavobacterium haoranii]